jgi:hypothetical protein
MLADLEIAESLNSGEYQPYLLHLIPEKLPELWQFVSHHLKTSRVAIKRFYLYRLRTVRDIFSQYMHMKKVISSISSLLQMPLTFPLISRQNKLVLGIAKEDVHLT